jgi:ectoine hydroxylase-related dioxygenase (phytanoyl-CoA dioxygenase family)
MNQSYDAMRQMLATKGYTVLKGLLTADEAQSYIDKLEAMSGFRRSDYPQTANKKGLSKRGLSTSWYQPDGVTKNLDFWPLIFNEQLLATVRAIVNPDVRYLQHSDLHVGFSAISWHRDSINRHYGVGPDWNESDAPYKLVRVGIYLQTYAESRFRLGFIPGSHRFNGVVTRGQKLTEAKLKWLGALSYMFTSVQMWAANAEWIATEPGDCIIFDPRTIHSGSAIIGPKYSMFLAYGLENRHFYNHQNYYRHVRPELGYKEMPSPLVAQLMTNGLYQDQSPVYNEIDGAWTPMPLMKNIVAQRVQST